MDCGKEIKISVNATKTYRCLECQKKYNRKIKTLKQREYRNKT